MQWDLSLPEARSVIVLAPHPDDEALGCGGTLSLLNGSGASSAVVFLTCGERLRGEPDAEIAAQRVTEARAVSTLLGCAEPLFLNLPDGDVAGHTVEAGESVAEIIDAVKPDIVFAPSPVDYHSDHIATAGIALKCLDRFRSFRLAFYEVYGTVRFNRLIDIGDIIEVKKKALMAYGTSLYGMSGMYTHAILGMNAHRSFFVQHRSYYEAFWIIDRPLTEGEISDWLLYGRRFT